MPNSERAFATLLIGLGIAISVVSWGYGFGSARQPGPGLYPFFIGLAIAIFAVSLLANASQIQVQAARTDAAQAKTLALMTLTFCAWILAMPLLGYVLVTLLVTYAFCKIMNLEGWIKPLALSLGTALFIYLLFDYWLYIDLPRGILG